MPLVVAEWQVGTAGGIVDSRIGGGSRETWELPMDLETNIDGEECETVM